MEALASNTATTNSTAIPVRIGNSYNMIFLLKDCQNKPLAKMPYTYEVDGITKIGTTDDSGHTVSVQTNGEKLIKVYIGNNPENPEDHGKELIVSAKSNLTVNAVTEGKTERLAKIWSVSNQGIAFMAEWESGVYNGVYKRHKVTEGMILTVYNDGYGLPTVGLGHLVLAEDHLKLGDTISLERARQLARKDLGKAEKPLNSRVNVPLYQHEYDALVSILFNTGAGKGKNEKVARVDLFAKILNQGKYDKVPDFIKNFIAKRVPYRRVTEAKLFKDGIYNAKH